MVVPVRFVTTILKGLQDSCRLWAILQSLIGKDWTDLIPAIFSKSMAVQAVKAMA
jgi:hypothetical protein